MPEPSGLSWARAAAATERPAAVSLAAAVGLPDQMVHPAVLLAAPAVRWAEPSAAEAQRPQPGAGRVE
ncbi:MAG: hypothetical protein ACRDIC_08855 [bacterium]